MTQDTVEVAVSNHTVNEQVFDYYLQLRRVREYVEAHYPEELSLSAVASVAGMEAKYFSAYFHRRVGLCFRDWLIRLRIEKAKTIMKTSDLPITHVALEVGFGDLRTFERAFKKTTGLTPLQYKKQVKP